MKFNYEKRPAGLTSSGTLTTLLLFSLIAFSGCLSSRKMDKWIDKHYAKTVPTKIKSNDYISIKMANPAKNDRVSNTQKGKSKWIPAVVYWQWELSTISTLNPAIPASNLSSALLPYANTKGLKQKLNGQKLELTIEKAPAVFSLKDKGHLIYVLVYYIGWEFIYIEPQKEELVVTYRLLKDDVETKKGVINVTNRDQPIALKMFQSPKRMTWRYLEQYNNNIKSMSRELVDKLLLEVQLQDNYVQR